MKDEKIATHFAKDRKSTPSLESYWQILAKHKRDVTYVWILFKASVELIPPRVLQAKIIFIVRLFNMSTAFFLVDASLLLPALNTQSNISSLRLGSCLR